MVMIVLYVAWIVFQLLLSIALSVYFDKIFERIFTKGRPRSFKSSDVLVESRLRGRIILFSGLALLAITIIINLIFMPLFGCYACSLFFVALGSTAFYDPKGRKITTNCWVTPCHRDDFIVTLNDRKILISGERLRGHPGHVIYTDNSPKWLSPHDSEPVTEVDYEYMLKAILTFLKNDGVIQRPGDDNGISMTKEDHIAALVRRGWTAETSSSGIKVSPPKKTKRRIWGR